MKQKFDEFGWFPIYPVWRELPTKRRGYFLMGRSQSAFGYPVAENNAYNMVQQEATW